MRAWNQPSQTASWMLVSWWQDSWHKQYIISLRQPMCLMLAVCMQSVIVAFQEQHLNANEKKHIAQPWTCQEVMSQAAGVLCCDVLVTESGRFQVSTWLPWSLPGFFVLFYCAHIVTSYCHIAILLQFNHFGHLCSNHASAVDWEATGAMQP